MKKHLNRLYVRMFFVAVIVVCATIALPMASTLWRMNALLEADEQERFLRTIGTLRPLLEDGTLPADSLENFLTEGIFEIAYYDAIEDLPLAAAEKQVLSDGANIHIVNEKPRDGFFIGVARIGERFLLASAHTNPLYQETRRHNSLIRIISLALCTLILLHAGRKFIKPIIVLDNAAKKVAAGDFGVHVPNRHTGGEIRSLIDSFNAMVRELGSVEMFRSTFISDVSHEFKIPLTTISGYSRLLQGECTEEEREEYAAIIMEESRHLSTLVDNILMLNRLEEHPTGAVEMESVDITEQVRRALTHFESRWTEKKIAMTFSLQEVSAHVNGVLLMQVWTNLIDNAVRFSPEGGAITITLCREADGVAFRIADEGAGMDEAAQRRIFDKFYKADHARNSEGNGLGLAIVRRIVEIHAGSVAVESAPGKGSLFTVCLPIRGNERQNEKLD